MPDTAGLAKGRATQMAEFRARAAARIEDTDHLLACGCGWAEVLHRVGFSSPAAAEKFFKRHGRPDLGTLFSLYAKRERDAA